MSNLINQLLEGNLSEEKIDFYGYHFCDRLRDNKIDFDYIKNQIMYEKPVSHYQSELDEDRYVFIYKAPSNKKYNHIRVILQDCEDYISVVTIMDHGRDPRYI